MADGSDLLSTLLRFGAFLAVAIVAPGVGLQRLARVRWDPALVLPLGLVACAFAYWLAIVSGVPLVFPLLTAIGAGTSLFGRRLGRAAGPSLRGALLPVAVLVCLFAVTQYRVNRVDQSGAFLLDVGEHVDTALHVGLTFELVAGYPPQVPGLAGVPMHYHVASHLVRAAAVRWAGIHPYDALNRFDITLWAVALVLALRAAAAAAGLGRAAVAAAGLLPLASDLSFVPGLLRGAEWWALRLGGNFVDPLFFANSITPALAMALAAIVALSRAEQGEGRGLVALAALLAAGAGAFKVFTGAQLVLALGLAWLLGGSRRKLLFAAIPAALALVLLAWPPAAPLRASGVSLELVPFAAAVSALAAFGIPPLRGGTFLLAGVAWLVLSLGLRVAGLPQAWRALRDQRVAARALAGLALCGWPLAMLLRITADPDYDESFYFLEASGLVLWLFAVKPFARLAQRSALAAALVVALLALPATAEFVARKASQRAEPVAPAAVQAMSALRAASCPGDVVITRPMPSWVPLPMVLGGRRVAFSNYLGYWRQFVSPQALEQRSRLERSFFRSRTPSEALAVAAALDGRYLYLSGRQAVDFDGRGILEPVFARDGERVYRIAPLARSDCRRR